MTAFTRCGSIALALAIGLLICGPIASEGPMVRAHSQLVTSAPGAGVVLEEAPAELRLVFSEPLEDDFTGLVLADAMGATIPVAARVDEADRRVLVAPLPSLPDGAYTVNWTALSAADGHVTAGFISFAIGEAMMPSPGGPVVPGMDGMEESGSVHAGHTGIDAAIENLSRGVGDLGFMLAFGLLIVGSFVVRPAVPGARGLLATQIASLALAAVGTLVLLSFAGSAANLDPIGYATGSRSGAFLGSRLVGATLLTVVACMVWASGHARAAAVTAALGGAIGILAIALGGHASALPGLAPIAAIVVHVAAAAIWTAGLVALVILGLSRQLPGDRLRAAVPRFSALALVAIGLVALTGGYSAWTQTRDLTPLQTPYATVLAAKVVVVALALVLGLLNLLDGGRDRGPLVRFAGRVRVEGILALVVVGLSSTLASGSPPGNTAPVAIEEAASTATRVETSLALQPGRPGPNRLLVQLDRGVPEGGAAEVQLLRLDRSGGTSTVDLRRRDGEPGWVADGVVLERGSRWDATVVVRDAEAAETGRARFAWALDTEGVAEGRSRPIVDPADLIAVVMLAAALLGLAFAVAGGRMPLVHPAVARRALLAGGAVGMVLGLVLLLGGAG